MFYNPLYVIHKFILSATTCFPYKVIKYIAISLRNVIQGLFPNFSMHFISKIKIKKSHVLFRKSHCLLSLYPQSLIHTIIKEQISFWKSPIMFSGKPVLPSTVTSTGRYELLFYSWSLWGNARKIYIKKIIIMFV